VREEFLLDPEVTFFNHGSFGACPRVVFERYQAWQRELELEPVDFIARRLPEALRLSLPPLLFEATFPRCRGRLGRLAPATRT